MKMKLFLVSLIVAGVLVNADRVKAGVPAGAILYANFEGATDAYYAGGSTVELHNPMLVPGQSGYGQAGRSREDATRQLATARKLGETIIAKYPRAPATPNVAFMIAYCWDQTVDPELDDAVAAFRRVHRKYPNSSYARQARFREIFHGMRTAYASEIDRFESDIKQFERDFPELTDWTSLLYWKLGTLREFQKSRAEKSSDSTE